MPVEMDIASEFRYRNPVIDERDLVIGITQSGETADTLAAMRLARQRGATVLAITNVMGSQATRDADGVLFTRAGLEIGVAATKTFVSQVAVMYLLGAEARPGARHAPSPSDRASSWPSCAAAAPDQRAAGAGSTSPIREIAEHWADAGFFLYLGRHVGLPVCLEGALKLKEISYIPTDAYAAGEMKHGPIALLDERTPVVCVATRLAGARQGAVEHRRGAGARRARDRGGHRGQRRRRPSTPRRSSRCPATDWLLQPILAVIPLQLLAYHIARARGLNVDQPRNLAKTVTVE